MRFSVKYQVEKIPINYRMKVYGLIKEAVRNASPEYYKKNFVEDRYEISPFSFATFLKDFKIENDIIHLKELTITISSDIEFAIHTFNGLLNLKTYCVHDTQWVQKGIKMLHEANITRRTAYFSTLSPILIEDKSGKPLSPRDENYEEELNYYASLKLLRIAGRELYEKIRFTPIQMRKMIVKEKNREFEKTMDQQMFLYYTTYKGLFKLEGHPEDLQLIYRYGVGRRSTYFGLLHFEGEEDSM